MTDRTRRWLEKGRRLPRFLRDFHDQKDLFKTLEQKWGREGGNYSVSWVAAQVYVIDRFLRFMALHGYTLQRTRAEVDTVELADTLKEAEAERAAAFREHFAARRADAALSESA